MSFSHDYFASAMLGVLLGNLVVYYFEKCVAVVQEKERMSDEEILTWMERNVTNCWSGEGIKCLSWTGDAYVLCEIEMNNQSVTQSGSQVVSRK